MGNLRSFARHVRWSDREVSIIVQHYEKGQWDDLIAMLPGRTRSQVQNKAYSLGITRYRPPARTPEQVRAAKRIDMAHRRAVDPDAAREYQRKDYWRNREARITKMKSYQRKRFFWLRASKLKSEVKAVDLARLWKQQRGLCALTGRRLTRDSAHLDHITAKARGGTDELANLRWLCTEANLALRELSDAEFVALCSDVMAWIGQRIAAVDAPPTSTPLADCEPPIR